MSLLWRRRRELHPDQIRAIEGLSPNGRYLLVGPPGSGKTSILLHRGQYLRLPPHNLTNVRLLAFSRTLREFIAVSGDERFPPGLIETFKSFVNRQFKTYGVSLPRFDDKTPLAEQDRLRALEILRLIEEQGPRVQYDALLVDEVQDLAGEEIELVCRLSERSMMVGDSRQKVHDSVGGLDAAKQHSTETIELKHHFRISPQICRVADAILVQPGFKMSDYEHYQGPPPSEPIAKGGLSRGAQILELAEALDLQLDTYNDPSDLIGVVAWQQADCNLVFGHLEALPRFTGLCRVFHSEIKRRSFGPACRICIVTLQSCKGLEFRALHWLFADENNYFITDERAYTAVTRAKSSLVVYHNGRLPGCLAGAFPPPALKLFEDDDD